jgi:hypothetical protein
MLPGPVFAFELMAAARRGRFYLLRAVYAVVLLVILWTVPAAWASETGSELSSAMVKWFAFSAFCSIAAGQEILALALTPALVAGVIADEKQRKTLHYLLASQLTSTKSPNCFSTSSLSTVWPRHPGHIHGGSRPATTAWPGRPS